MALSKRQVAAVTPESVASSQTNVREQSRVVCHVGPLTGVANRGVAQRIARMVWDHEVGGSNPLTPTTKLNRVPL